MAPTTMSVIARRFGLGVVMICAIALLTASSLLSGAPRRESIPVAVRRDDHPALAERAAKPPVNSPADPQGRVDGYLASGRWREGSKLVDAVGQFKVSGDRAAFHPADGKNRFLCLENLNSERVARIVTESPEALDWIVQGTITEFRGENYLLITQAVIRTRATRGLRQPLEQLPTAGDLDRSLPKGATKGG
jgi:hypothetical protein